MSPTVRLAVRAVLAGILAFGNAIIVLDIDTLTGGDWIKAAIGGVIAAAVLASAELGTSLNPNVGLGKPEGGTSK